MTADHVAQQGPQMVSELPHQRVGPGAHRCRPGDRGTLQRERLRDSSHKRPALGGYRTERRQPPAEQPAGGPLGLEQRPQRQQVVAQRLVLGRTFAAHPEACQRPRQLAIAWSAPRDEVAERAQLILLLCAHDQHPARSPTPAEGPRTPAATADACPREPSERDAAVAEQAQRLQQLREHRSTAPERRHHIGVLRRERHQQSARLPSGLPPLPPEPARAPPRARPPARRAGRSSVPAPAPAPAKRSSCRAGSPAASPPRDSNARRSPAAPTRRASAPRAPRTRSAARTRPRSAPAAPPPRVDRRHDGAADAHATPSAPRAQAGNGRAPRSSPAAPPPSHSSEDAATAPSARG